MTFSGQFAVTITKLQHADQPRTPHPSKGVDPTNDRRDSRFQPVESSCLWRSDTSSVSVKQESQSVTAGNPLPSGRGGCQL